MYNGLVRLRAACESAWADIDVQLKRRYDLIPNLVETVKAYAAHEKGAPRPSSTPDPTPAAAQGRKPKAAAETTSSLAIVVCARGNFYPQLRAVEAFTQLQGSLNQIEDALQNARRYYNAVVRDQCQAP